MHKIIFKTCTCTRTSAFVLNILITDIDECLDGNPCLNGGTCTNSLGSFFCSCASEYSGATCNQCKNDTFVILIIA